MRVARSRGRVIMTASRGSEVSLEVPEPAHGIFTYHLVLGLRGAGDLDGDGTVTLQELCQYVEREVSRPSRAAGGRLPPVPEGEIEGPLPMVRSRP